ncbi:hypothetical protein GOP47_0016352 [Adiantum capillus-veneris]|uniref:Uncharacterized protein n=1 Tax=Adiantum capillus-veneris TaxID=13818 RepID=A0A9D4UHZ1_ADICA|nr:hypothetical protein GOP47_0016352 [Adiantum capillus-veneris]
MLSMLKSTLVNDASNCLQKGHACLMNGFILRGVKTPSSRNGVEADQVCEASFGCKMVKPKENAAQPESNVTGNINSLC